MLQPCRLCPKFSTSPGEAEPWDTVLFESANFIAVPTLGSIIAGWVLIIPRAHFLCVGAFDSQLLREFISFTDSVVSTLRATFGSVACFEHGPSAPCTSIGCGVDHAHLHVVATTVDLRAGADRIAAGKLSWTQLDRFSTLSNYYAEGMAYLYLKQFGRSWICSPHKIESQLFRKVLANATGQPNMFDWKQYSFTSAVQETIRKIDAAKPASVVNA